MTRVTLYVIAIVTIIRSPRTVDHDVYSLQSSMVYHTLGWVQDNH